MNLYQALNQDLREFKYQEKLLKESENKKSKNLKEAALDPSYKSIWVTTEKAPTLSSDTLDSFVKDFNSFEDYDLGIIDEDKAVFVEPQGNNEFRIFTKSESLLNKIKEELISNGVTLNESIEQPTQEDLDKDTALTKEKKNKDIEDRLGELRLALQDDAISEDEKAQVTKEISELEDKLNECSSSEIKDGEDCKNCEEKKESTIPDDPSKVIPLKDEEMSETCTEIQHLINAQNIIDEIISIITDEGSIDPDKAKELATKAKKEIEGHYNECTLESIKDSEDEQEEIQECEIKSFRVLRKAPKTNSYMLEAQTKEGLKYITGRNFDDKEKTLEEAEVHSDKNKATEAFKSLLK